MLYFISDLHFDDKNIFIYSRNNFKSMDDMNNTIISNWNNKVSEDDTIYLLGDIGNYKYLKQLKGNIKIVLVNHDNKDDIKKEYPNLDIYDKSIFDKWMILSHKPIVFIPKDCPYLNIYGHLNQYDYGNLNTRNWYEGNRYFNVSCEKINYTPISVEEIIKEIGYIKN